MRLSKSIGRLFITVFFAWMMVVPLQAAHGQSIGLLDPLNRLTATTESGKTLVSRLQGRVGSLLATLFALIGMASVFPIVIGGIDLITSQGNPQLVEKGKKTLYWGLIGLILGLSGIGFYYFFLDIFLRPRLI